MTSSEQPDREITFTPEALRNIHNCLKHLMDLRHKQEINFSDDTDKKAYDEAAWSFIYSLKAVFGLAGKISADDEHMSLYGVSFIHYGMIFHRSSGTWSVHS